MNGESVTSDEIEVVTLLAKLEGVAFTGGVLARAEPPKNNVAESTLVKGVRWGMAGFDVCKPETRRLGTGDPASDEDEEDGEARSRNWEAALGKATTLGVVLA